jgi:hypothetical protein
MINHASILINAWDYGNERASLCLSLRLSARMKRMLKTAARFGMETACYQEYVDGYKQGQANRGLST